MIQFKTIDGLLLRDMVMAGTAILEKNREAVDALNVFPVPDGDTGTNMSLTMQSATREINSKEYLRADEAANALVEQYNRRSETGKCDYITFENLPHGSGVEMFNAKSLLEARSKEFSKILTSPSAILEAI